MRRLRLSVCLVLAITLISAIAVVAPAPQAEAREWRSAGKPALAAAARHRAQLRKAIGNKHFRPGRPALDPGFARPLPGHGAIIRDHIRREIRKDIRKRFIGRVVAGVVLGAIINVSRAGQIPGPPPRSDLCWEWSDNARTRGFWTFC